MKEKGNIDLNNIIIAGDSRGAMGTIYLAANMEKMPYKFSKAVVVSGFETGTDLSKIKIPTIGFYGDHNEDAIPFMSGKFAKYFETTQLESDHNNASKTAYQLDENHNGCSDLIEWMLDGSGQNIEFFDENITFREEYIDDAGVIPFGLFTPSTVNKATELPLIIWLHGMGEVGKSETEFKNAKYRSAIYFKKLG